eukprot:TRINITY_DN3343_c0_g1_i1.p1 TRINITY_DN3343_c0_g1~~TRINITY_DN3343_c0_g1_i1.p1  ORF type:complete len:296 (+),score=10.25 TRINITY_DN3343_c0_g1_i1:298-1185(+)
MQLSSTLNSVTPVSSVWPRALLSFCYLGFVAFTTAITMTIVHYRVPDQENYPPLPDVVLDNLQYIPWAFRMCEYIAVILMMIFSVVMIGHRYRIVILWRISTITGTVFLLRCITMFATSLSVPGTHLNCKVTQETGIPFETLLHRAWEITLGLGLSIKGVRTCGDYMFSGHTSALTILNYTINEYTPSDWKGLHIASWVMNFFGMFLVLAAHEHYTIDVLIAFYISSRLFVWYHAMANSRPVSSSIAMTAVFPLFGYLEDETKGVIPNEYEWPWTAIKRGYLSWKHYFGTAFGKK